MVEVDSAAVEAEDLGVSEEVVQAAAAPAEVGKEISEVCHGS